MKVLNYIYCEFLLGKYSNCSGMKHPLDWIKLQVQYTKYHLIDWCLDYVIRNHLWYNVLYNRGALWTFQNEGCSQTIYIYLFLSIHHCLNYEIKSYHFVPIFHNIYISLFPSITYTCHKFWRIQEHRYCSVYMWSGSGKYN